MTPNISVITPTYNSLNTLKRVYKSLSLQTFQNWEWIVVNDESKDETKKYLEHIKLLDNRIKIHHNQKNVGVAQSRNNGLNLAVGKYICFLDADDYWMPEKLETHYRFMKNNQHILLSFMDYDRVDEQGNHLNTVQSPEKVSYKDLLKSNHIGNLTSICSRELIGKTRFMQIGHEDYVFWLELLKKTEYAYKCETESSLCKYTVSNSSLSSNKLKTLKWQWKIYRDTQKLNFVESLFYTINYIYYAIKKRK